jgi:hypothetical protein
MQTSLTQGFSQNLFNFNHHISELNKQIYFFRQINNAYIQQFPMHFPTMRNQIFSGIQNYEKDLEIEKEKMIMLEKIQPALKYEENSFEPFSTHHNSEHSKIHDVKFGLSGEKKNMTIKKITPKRKFIVKLAKTEKSEKTKYISKILEKTQKSNEKSNNIIKNKKSVFHYKENGILSFSNETPKDLSLSKVHKVRCRRYRTSKNSNTPFYSNKNGKSQRGSQYRGVSRNGNQWQVLIMVKKQKLYLGSFTDEKEAGKAYDMVAIKNHGLKAKTNFLYTDEEIRRLLQ